MTTRIPNPPPESIFNLNLKQHQPYMVDLPPLGTVGARREQAGWVYVRAEILDKQPTWGDKAGISDGDFKAFLALDDQVRNLVALLPAVAKAREVLLESLANVDNLRHRLVTHFANSAESHARMGGGNPTLLTAYQRTIAYRSIIADKGVKTRKKNEEEKKAGKPAEPAAPAASAAPAAPGEKEPRVVSRAPNPPPDMIFAIDLNPLRPFLVDLPPGATKGMRRVQEEEWPDVVQEIIDSHAIHGAKDGITDSDFNRFLALNDQYRQIEAALPAVEKAVEIVEESLVYNDNLRHQYVTQFADSAEEHATQDGGDPALLTSYERTIAYRAVIAEKAVKTRKENEAAKKAAAGAKGPTGPATPASAAAPSTGATGPTGPTGATGP